MIGRHELEITARVFSRLPWPTKTTTWATADRDCDDVDRYAQTLRDLGARVVVHHVNHRPPRAPEVDPS